MRHYITISSAEQPIRLLGWSVPSSPELEPQVCFESAFEQLEALVPSLLENLQRCSAFKNITDCSGIFWVRGPGSFTALRTTAAFLQTLTFCNPIPVLGFSRFEIWKSAARARDANALLVGLFGGRMHLYAAHYVFSEQSKRWLPKLEPQRMSLETFEKYLATLSPDDHPPFCAGSGFERYPHLAHYYKGQPIELQGGYRDPDQALLLLGLQSLTSMPFEAARAPSSIEPEYLIGLSHWQLPHKPSSV